MSNLKPCSSGNSSGNMVSKQMPPRSGQMGETNSASGSRSVRESGNGSVISVDHLTDHSSLRTTRSRPLARLDRLLRRWLPGYNYLRGAIANASSGSGNTGNTIDRPETETPARRPSLAGSVEQQRSGHQVSAICVEPTLPVRKRKDGEVLLDTGIAKSEFCMKLEKLLRAKLIVKD
ncbi:uncharacterized protein LOC117790285 [Drosophila innubila]|uniref:uncharacterized protein LOC117790285 n=1 Tax=Drosophila innubila TaxID=198719 RepID=UPI00148C190F|nr:uncharacterized protein LOC117790285 [Drosophila innubila]